MPQDPPIGERQHRTDEHRGLPLATVTRAGYMSPADKAKLDALSVVAAAPAATVATDTATIPAAVVHGGLLGLGADDHPQYLNTARAGALYEPLITAGTTAQYLRGDKSLGTLNQAAVAGLTTADVPVFAGQVLQLASDTAGTIPFQTFYKAGGTLASPTALTTNAYIGAVYARGYAGATTGYALRAGLLFYCSGTPDDATGSMPISAIMQTGTTAQVSRQYWLADGKVGIGAVPTVGFDVAMQTYIYSGTYPALRVDRTGSGTNTVLTAFEVRQKTTGDMADGFGAEMAWSVQDSSGTDNLLATIAAIRAGADNTGDLYGRVRAAGVSKDAWITRSTGVFEAKYALQVATGFGCNSKSPQTAYASGGAVTTGAGAYGFASDAERIAVTALLTNIRAALVANGIMS